jgi:hypothetical protein
LDFLSRVPSGAWWDLDALIRHVRRERPAFQRPGGDFDSWYLSDPRSGASLRGFEHWDAVEGQLIRFLIEGPLAWLGTLDLGVNQGVIVAFRKLDAFAELSPTAEAEPARAAPASPALAQVLPDGLIRVPIDAAATLRYQIARFAGWIEAGPEGYLYRLTPSAMAAAKSQGLTAEHVRAILEKASGEDLPDGLAKGLVRWSRRGAEGRLETTTVLVTSEPRVLRELLNHRATARFLGPPLGPTAVRIKTADIPSLLSAAASLGLLLDPPVSAEGL